MSLPPKVFLVEDDHAVRKSLQFQIETMGFDVSSFASAITFLENYVPVTDRECCLLLDVRMPDMSGIELQQLLTDRQDPMPVVMISGHADVPAAVRAMKNGASDFLSKPVKGEDLEKALKHALAETATVRIDVPIEEIRERIQKLTPRESEVLNHVVDGHSSRQIADKLSVSFKTIEAHRAKIMSKTRAENVAHLVRMCLAERV